MPWPGGQVLQSAHAPLPADALNWPLAHVAHTRSDVAVAATLRYWPASHAALTDTQVLPSLAVENVEPARQSSQTRSAVAEPAVRWPWPAAHVRQGLHAPLPVVALKVPLAHAVHTRSDEAPGAAVS
jgi:hypothetical protein